MLYFFHTVGWIQTVSPRVAHIPALLAAHCAYQPLSRLAVLRGVLALLAVLRTVDG
jgi:hypothetical protein